MRNRLYPEPFDYTNAVRSNEEWPDHRLRALTTASMLAWMQPGSVIDPACGDGSIVRSADKLWPIERAWLSDLSEPNILALVVRLEGTRPQWSLSRCPLEQALNTFSGTYEVGVLTEILEHIEDPDALLRLAATKVDRLLVSSPEMRPNQFDNNPEHLWMFDGEGYERMLNEAGWKVTQKTHLTFRSEYDFQIYVADKP